jgi:Rha family phage regulatory protein
MNGYDDFAAPHRAVGISLSCEAVKSRTSSAVFLRLGSSVYGCPGGSNRKVGRRFTGKANSRSVAHPISLGSAVNHRNWSNAMSSNTPAIRPHVEFVNGQLVTNSFKIADHFGKNHKDVLRAIDGLECSVNFRQRNFAPTSASVPMPRGGVRQIKAYSITRDGFTFLAMGFTGSRAAQWKEAYINAFNRMEAELLQHPNQHGALPIGAFVTMHASAQALAGHRYLVTFNDDGTGYRAKPIPSDCFVMNTQQFVKAISEPNGMYIESATLVDLIVFCARRLESRVR